MDEAELLRALDRAKGANVHARDCQVCVALESMSDLAREAVESALAGTIGTRRLAEILTQSGYGVGRRAVIWHQSGHTRKDSR